MRFPERRRRIGPLPRDQQSERQRQLLDATGMRGLPATNIFATLARNERLFGKWLPFCGTLLNGRLGARERELVIMRVARLCESGYEWAQHEVLARRAGLTQHEIDSIAGCPEAEEWSSLDATLLRAVSEVHASNVIREATWTTLSETYGEADLIELLMLIGQYRLVAVALNSLGVQVEADDTEAVTR